VLLLILPPILSAPANPQCSCQSSRQYSVILPILPPILSDPANPPANSQLSSQSSRQSNKCTFQSLVLLPILPQILSAPENPPAYPQCTCQSSSKSSVLLPILLSLLSAPAILPPKGPGPSSFYPPKVTGVLLTSLGNRSSLEVPPDLPRVQVARAPTVLLTSLGIGNSLPVPPGNRQKIGNRSSYSSPDLPIETGAPIVLLTSL
jgi:hypothetical protein